ncbi:AMP-binding protein [Nocardiopsis potens]|uniref:AMP-binding protein n=1 Tax=Nocardiopsis potens TaxID=1246458 RepID=UPI000349F77D|nr:AMP-binding protein [Nocardiopsis potens]
MGQRSAWEGTLDAGSLRGLADILYRNAEDGPGAEVAARRDAEGAWERVTAARMLNDVTALAKGLIGTGVDAGDRVVIVGGADYDQLLMHFAVWAVRAVAVPLPANCSQARLLHVVRDCRPAAVVLGDGRLAAAASAASRDIPDLSRVWRLDGPEGLEAVSRPGAYMDSSAVRFRLEETTAADPAVIAYPAGTDVRRPGAVLSHGDRLAAARALADRLLPALRGAGAGSAGALVHLRLSDSAGQAAVAACMLARVRVGVVDPAEKLVEQARAFRPAVLVAAADAIEEVYAAEERRARQSGWDSNSAFGAAAEIAAEYDRGGRKGAWKRVSMAMYDWMYSRFREAYGGRLRLAVALGGRVPATLDHFYNGAGVPLVQVFGSTEAGGALTAGALGARRAGTHGTALEGVELRVGPGGELFAHGPGVFPGYWNAQAAGETAFRDGWLATGYTGEIDDDGYVTVTGRLRVQACADPAPRRAAVPQPPPERPAQGGGGEPAPAAAPARPAAELPPAPQGPPAAPEQHAVEQARPAAAALPAAAPAAPAPTDPEEIVAGLERRISAHSLVGQVMVIGRGRPYCTALVTLAADQLEYWRLVNNRPLNASPEEIAADPDLLREIEYAVGEANTTVPAPLAVRAFHVLAEEFTPQSGLLLPDGSLRRDAVLRAFAEEIEGLYRSVEPGRQG